MVYFVERPQRQFTTDEQLTMTDLLDAGRALDQHYTTLAEAIQKAQAIVPQAPTPQSQDELRAQQIRVRARMEQIQQTMNDPQYRSFPFEFKNRTSLDLETLRFELNRVEAALNVPIGKNVAEAAENKRYFGSQYRVIQYFYKDMRELYSVALSLARGHQDLLPDTSAYQYYQESVKQMAISDSEKWRLMENVAPLKVICPKMASDLERRLREDPGWKPGKLISNLFS